MAYADEDAGRNRISSFLTYFFLAPQDLLIVMTKVVAAVAVALAVVAAAVANPAVLSLFWLDFPPLLSFRLHFSVAPVPQRRLG